MLDAKLQRRGASRRQSDKRRLMPLISGGNKDDPGEDLKGLALRALWPEQLSMGRLLPILARPKREHHGQYINFLISDFADGLQPKDIPKALQWASSLKIMREEDYDLHAAVEAVMRKALRHLTDPRILRGFARLAAAQIRAFEPISGRGFHQQELLGRDQVEIRRLIVAATLPHLANDQSSPGLLLFSEPQLVYPDDFYWMIERLDAARTIELKAAWSRLIRRSFDISSTAQVNAVIIECRKNNAASLLNSGTFYANSSSTLPRPTVSTTVSTAD